MSRFQCSYADPGQDRCPEWRCDCFIDLYPDDPDGLHPGVFDVGVKETDVMRECVGERDA